MPAIGALVEDKLVADLDMDATAFDSDARPDETTLTSGCCGLKPTTRARKLVAPGVSQLAKPQTMMTLTTSEKQIKVPTFALGIEWSGAGHEVP